MAQIEYLSYIWNAFFIRLVLNFKVVDYLIDPIVAGTSAGDPDSLSVSTNISVFCFLY